MHSRSLSADVNEFVNKTMFDVCHKRRGSYFYAHYKHSPLHSVCACVCSAYPHRMIVSPIDGKTTACCARAKWEKIWWLWRIYRIIWMFRILQDTFWNRQLCANTEKNLWCEWKIKPADKFNNLEIVYSLSLTLIHTHRETEQYHFQTIVRPNSHWFVCVFHLFTNFEVF